MLRVLSISTLFPNAARPAFGLFVARQAEALARRGDTEMVVINPVAIAPPPLGRFLNTAEERALPAKAQDWGVTVHYPRFPYIPRYGVRFNAALIARAVLPLARRLHAEQPFDMVDAQFFYPDGPAAAAVAKALGLPLSIKARGSDIILWSQKDFARKQLLAAADQATGLLAVSEALKRDMAGIGIAEGKITVHYTGLDHTRFHPQPRAEARAASTGIVPSDGKLLVTVGNLVHHKGQHLVMAALQQFPDTRLVLAGKGVEEARLRALASQLGVADRVHFAGSVKPDQLAVLLSGADIMVLASEREGLANAWVEALACGTPIVIAEAGGAREVVRDASAGQIVDRNVESIVAGVKAVLAKPPTQAEATANAARFSWDGNAEKLAAYYRGLVGKS
jgi:teichuronic acid biosynthesis glycosyltransferase TuaC